MQLSYLKIGVEIQYDVCHTAKSFSLMGKELCFFNSLDSQELNFI